MLKEKIALFLLMCVVAGFTLPVNAVTQNDQVNAEYLKKQGYSPELIRLVDLQKTRTDSSTVADENSIQNDLWTTKAKSFVKQLFRMNDATMSTDFGNNKIKY